MLEIAWVKNLKHSRDIVNDENQYERGTNVAWTQVESEDRNMSLETCDAFSPIGVALSSPSYL